MTVTIHTMEPISYDRMVRMLSHEHDTGKRKEIVSSWQAGPEFACMVAKNQQNAERGRKR